jgi:nicotinamide-nucleotide amidase
MSTAEIIAVGSELLGRNRLDTNSLYLTALLEKYGIEVNFKSIVGDHIERLSNTVANAIKRSDVILITGGLGPTDDDITREAVAQALGKKLILDHTQLEILKKRYEKAQVKFKENSVKQAYLIEGAKSIKNEPGSAPGQFINYNATLIFLLPGVPREMKFMAETFVEQVLKKNFNKRKKFEVVLNFAGLPESLVDSKLSNLNFKENNIEYTILSSLKRVQVILSSKDKAKVELYKNKVLAILKNAFYGEGDLFLAEAVLKLLESKNLTLSVAESCTGGYLGKQLTDIPGSSKTFVGGVICYSDSLKEQLLSVPNHILKQYGAVSANTAGYLSNGVRVLTNSLIGIGITGIAGPGNSSYKPQGLVYISVSNKEKTIVERFNFGGTREMVRERAVAVALNLLKKRFLD